MKTDLDVFVAGSGTWMLIMVGVTRSLSINDTPTFGSVNGHAELKLYCRCSRLPWSSREDIELHRIPHVR